jgi:hypothetical protein
MPGPIAAPTPTARSTLRLVAPLGPGIKTAFVPLTILGIDVDGISTPKDGAPPPSPFYNVPIKLSARAPSEGWCQSFETAFRRLAEPALAGSGMVSVHGDRIILMATTIEEVERVHMKALLIALATANSTVGRSGIVAHRIERV